MHNIPTRQAILAYLQKNTSATAIGLSQALDSTIPNIRHHLSILLQEGAIMAFSPPRSRQSGRGRPTTFYRLSPHNQPDNLDRLASALLELVQSPPPSALKPADPLAQLAYRLFNFSGPAATLTQRLNHVIRQLNLHHYQARWEAGAAGPQIQFRNCPYAAILPEHPELCRFDCKALEIFLRRPVKMTAKIDSTQPHSACIFQLLAPMKE